MQDNGKKPSFGDAIKFRINGKDLSGRFISSDGELAVIKLDSGYNISVPIDEIDIGEIRSNESRKEVEYNDTFGTGDKKILMLHTGGTIASRVDYLTGAVSPVRDIGFLKPGLRGLEKNITVQSRIIGNILSENMTPQDWINISNEIWKEIHNYDGIIVTHGTDTMTYTGSALSFMFEKLSVPIILTGSQRSSDRPSSDSFLNIGAAIRAALEDIGEVCISMHSDLSDENINIIRAVRARKMHTSRRNAIRSMGSGIVANVSGDHLTMHEHLPRNNESILKNKLEKRASLYYFSPVSDPEELISTLRDKKIAVIMATGLGHVAERIIGPIRELSESGVRVIITSQTINGMVDLDVYSTGRKMKSAGAISAQRILPEVALVKAMWVHANYPESEFSERFQENMRGENPGREIIEGS